MNKVIILGSELPRLNAVFPPDLEASPRQSMARAIFAVCLLWIFWRLEGLLLQNV